MSSVDVEHQVEVENNIMDSVVLAKYFLYLIEVVHKVILSPVSSSFSLYLWPTEIIFRPKGERGPPI